LADSIRQAIAEQTALGVHAGRIRINLDLGDASVDQLYGIRRNVLKRAFEHQTRDLHDFISRLDPEVWEIQILEDGDRVLKAVYGFHLPVLRSKYPVENGVQVDDTSGTNLFGMALEFVTTFDANNFTQICGFALLRYRSTDLFAEFFRAVKQINPSIFVFVGDRHGGLRRTGAWDPSGVRVRSRLFLQ
jgi:hypothetical protein